MPRILPSTRPLIDDFLGVDVGLDAAVGANRQGMPFQFDTAFDFAIEEKIFAT